MKSAKKYSGSSLILLALVTTIIIGCKKNNDYQPMSSSSTSNPPANEVWIQGSAFNPSSITVSVNTTVTWKNKDSYTHTVTSNTGAFDSGNISAGGTYTHQFTTAGTYPYHCNIHSMSGQVVVQ